MKIEKDKLTYKPILVHNAEDMEVHTLYQEDQSGYFVTKDMSNNLTTIHPNSGAIFHHDEDPRFPLTKYLGSLTLSNE